MAKLFGTECATCATTLGILNTADWDGQGGNCDTCNWDIVDGSLARQDARDQAQIDRYRNN
jgi:hypothetical protein